MSRLLTRVIPSHILLRGPLVIHTRVRIVTLQLTIVVGNVNITVQHFLLVVGIDVCIELLGYANDFLFLGVAARIPVVLDVFDADFALDDGSVLVCHFHLQV